MHYNYTRLAKLINIITYELKNYVLNLEKNSELIFQFNLHKGQE